MCHAVIIHLCFSKHVSLSLKNSWLWSIISPRNHIICSFHCILFMLLQLHLSYYMFIYKSMSSLRRKTMPYILPFLEHQAPVLTILWSIPIFQSSVHSHSKLLQVFTIYTSYLQSLVYTSHLSGLVKTKYRCPDSILVISL